MYTKNKLIGGWGINDVGWSIAVSVKTEQGIKQIMCPYYRKWKNMIVRVFNEKEHKRYPNYKGCTICEEWRHLSNFVKWVDNQSNRDWMNCDLDKDLIMNGNKNYCPDYCIFVTKRVNYFILSGNAKRGNFMIGVSKSGSKFKASIKNLNNKSECLGCYETELQAHKAWQERKHQYACQLADLQTDSRIAEALRQRYSPDKDWTNA